MRDKLKFILRGVGRVADPEGRHRLGRRPECPRRDLFHAAVALIILADLLERHPYPGRPLVALHLPEFGTLLQITNHENFALGQGLFIRLDLFFLDRLAGNHQRLAKVAAPEARLGQALELLRHLGFRCAVLPGIDIHQSLRRVAISIQREVIPQAQLAKRRLHLGLGLLPQVTALHAGTAVEQYRQPLAIAFAGRGGVVDRDERPRKNKRQQ